MYIKDTLTERHQIIMSVLVPWDHVKAILAAHGDTLQVIVLALPCKAKQVYTSKLLLSIFPNQGFKKTINGFIALRMYMVCWHYFRHSLEESKSPHWEAVDIRLKADQQGILDVNGAPNSDVLLAYLHAYEVALCKCMHLKRLLTAEFADDKCTNELTTSILNMNGAIVEALGIRNYLTPVTFPEPTSGDLDMIAQLDKQQEGLNSDIHEKCNQHAKLLSTLESDVPSPAPAAEGLEPAAEGRAEDEPRGEEPAASASALLGELKL